MRIDSSGDHDKDQFFTPEWAALELVERILLPMLPERALVVEPSCGLGSFLKAFPPQHEVIGFEIDQTLAILARKNTRRVVHSRDFLEANELLDGAVDLVVGNPPFKLALFEKFLDRAHRMLRRDGRCAFILPAYFFQTSTTVARMAAVWSLEQYMIPRDLFYELTKPLVFVIFRKGGSSSHKGFLLYTEQEQVRSLSRRSVDILVSGRPKLGVWDALITDALIPVDPISDCCYRTLQELYEFIGPKAPKTNSFPNERIRATLYRGEGKRYSRNGQHWSLKS